MTTFEESEKMNGWTNQETWLVNLWLTNEETIYDRTMELSKTPIEYEFKRADKLQDYVLELVDEGVITDHISLWRVNYTEILESFKQTIRENEELKT